MTQDPDRHVALRPGRWCNVRAPMSFARGGTGYVAAARPRGLPCVRRRGVTSHAAMLPDLGLWPVRTRRVTIRPGPQLPQPDGTSIAAWTTPRSTHERIEGIPVTARPTDTRRPRVRRVLRDRLEKCVERALFRGHDVRSERCGRTSTRSAGKAGAACNLCERSSSSADVSPPTRATSRPRWCSCSDGLVSQSRSRQHRGRRGLTTLPHRPRVSRAEDRDRARRRRAALRGEQDRRRRHRDGLLQLGGWLTQHFTKRHIRHEEHATAERMWAAIRSRSLGAIARGVEPAKRQENRLARSPWG